LHVGFVWINCLRSRCFYIIIKVNLIAFVVGLHHIHREEVGAVK